jgi:hypothetical protein
MTVDFPRNCWNTTHGSPARTTGAADAVDAAGGDPGDDDWTTGPGEQAATAIAAPRTTDKRESRATRAI